MAEKKLLATFIAEEIKETFNIYGSYEIKTGKELDIFTEGVNMIDFKYPEFCDITATNIVDDREEDYVPVGETWAGRKYTATDMIEFLISALIKGDETYTKLNLESGLQELVNDYLTDDKIAIAVNGKKIPKRILTNTMYDLYQLILVTDAYIYYVHEDQTYMLSTEDHTVISDNYFAEVGYWDSVENVKSGKETLLWGELPEED